MWPCGTPPQGLSYAVCDVLHLVTTLQIIVPLVSDEVHLKVQVPVAQEWIAGKVPQTVVTGGNLAPITIPIGGGTSGSSGLVKTGGK